MTTINQMMERLAFLEKDDLIPEKETGRWYGDSAYTPHRKVSQWLLDHRAVLLLVTNLVLLSALMQKSMYQVDPTLALYSPVNDIISYKTVTFDGVRSARTKYMPPTAGGLPDDNVDLAWDYLYRGGIVKVPKETASQLVNWTSPIPGDESNYITMLDVFHQLHCLNLLRRSLYPERYNRTLWDGAQLQTIDNYHLEHCVDSLRQLIMCQSDVSTHYWRWEPWHEQPKVRTYDEVTHTCRDFEAIHSWAIEHALKEFDPFTHVDDPLRKGIADRREGPRVY